jgi:hypothetical protein
MARRHKEDDSFQAKDNLTDKESQKVVSNVLACGHHHHNYVTVNYFNKLYYGIVRSYISLVTNNYEVGQTMLLEETFNDETRLTGRKLVCIVDNIGIHITGLKEGYCVVTLRLK